MTVLLFNHCKLLSNWQTFPKPGAPNCGESYDLRCTHLKQCPVWNIRLGDGFFGKYILHNSCTVQACQNIC